MKFDFSGLAKNKNLIIILLAMVIVCGGSLLGVKSMTSNFQPQTDVSTTTQAPTISTTVPTTTEPPTTTTTTEAPTTTTMPSTDSNITTFPVDGTTTTIPTTQPTTAATTDNGFTFPSLQMPSTTASSGSSSGGSLLGGLTGNLSSNIKPDGTLFDQGVAGFQFNQTGNYYYTNTDPWQRTLGYNEL